MQEDEGKLKKFIAGCLAEEDAINWGWGKTALEELDKIVDEANKEFPTTPCDSSLSTYDILNNFYCDVVEWFKKWHGEAK